VKLGFLTVCLGNIPLEEKAKWAASQGFQTLEVACWPKKNDRDYAASDIDVDGLTAEKAEEIKGYMKENNLEISSLAYYDNNLDANLEHRAFVNAHLKKCIDAAVLLGVPSVGTFVGRNIEKSLKDNFDEFETVFGELVSYAQVRGVQIVIENCPMVGWQKPGVPGTISFTPELWEEMFKRVPNENFGLNFDPSHLYFQLIDYLPLLEKFKSRIFHFHAKDAEIFKEKLSYYGIFDSAFEPHGKGYWRYRMPGLGQISWKEIFKELKKIGYDFVVSIEHEDHLYEGSERKVKEGLALGLKHLKESL